MDNKSKASGEISGQNEMQEGEQRFSVSPVQKALMRLQARTLTELSEDETKIWKEDLSKVPVWKLQRIDEFTGSRMSEVWKFFESLHKEPETFKALPAPEQSDRVKMGTHFVLQYCQEIGKAENHYERLKMEYEFAEVLRTQYNHPYTPILDQ